MDITSLPFDGQLHDGAAQILNHSPVGIFAVQSNREGQPRGPADNHIVFAKVGETDKRLAGSGRCC